MLLDNKLHGRVSDALAENLKPGAQLAVLSSNFSVYAYKYLAQNLSQISRMRLLIPTSRPVLQEAIFRVEGLTGKEIDRRLRNTLTLANVARECAAWI